jgi:single stranded DNA-binding protein (ssb)
VVTCQGKDIVVSTSINRVIVLGNLTRDPELRSMPSGNPVCSLRIAVNDSVKDANTGEWRDHPNYFDVDVFGSQGENCSKWLSKGRQVAIEGRLRWRSWETQEGQKRSAVASSPTTCSSSGRARAGPAKVATRRIDRTWVRETSPPRPTSTTTSHSKMTR